MLFLSSLSRNCRYRNLKPPEAGSRLFLVAETGGRVTVADLLIADVLRISDATHLGWISPTNHEVWLWGQRQTFRQDDSWDLSAFASFGKGVINCLFLGALPVSTRYAANPDGHLGNVCCFVK